MQNSGTNVIALTSHVESNTFYFPSLSMPVLLYLPPQFSCFRVTTCFRVTAVSYILVAPKPAVIATEKSNLTLALAVGSGQHCPSLVPSRSLWLHSKLGQEDELGYKDDTAFTAHWGLDLALCCWWHLKKTIGPSAVWGPPQDQPKRPGKPLCVLSVRTGLEVELQASLPCVLSCCEPAPWPFRICRLCQ